MAVVEMIAESPPDRYMECFIPSLEMVCMGVSVSRGCPEGERGTDNRGRSGAVT
jgi:hypothetical protein